MRSRYAKDRPTSKAGADFRVASYDELVELENDRERDHQA